MMPSQLRDAIALTGRYVDLTAEGTDAYLASRLPASPAAIEDAVGTVLAALRDPAGRKTLSAIGSHAHWLLDPRTDTQLEQVLALLPQFLSPSEAALREAVAPVIDSYERSGQAGVDIAANADLVRGWSMVAARTHDESARLLDRVRSRRWEGSAAAPSLPVSTKSGCSLLLGIAFLAGTFGLASFVLSAAR